MQSSYLQKVLHPLCQVLEYLEIYQNALDLQGKTNIYFTDLLILAGALREGCTILYSEDLQDGYQVDGLELWTHLLVEVPSSIMGNQ